MMDPGTALAITSLVIDVGWSIIQFISNWKDAPESVTGFSRELTLLNGNLARTQVILQSSEYKAAFNTQPIDVKISHGSDDHEIFESITNYQAQLQSLQDELRGEQSRFFRKHWHRFVTAVKSDKLKESMARVNRCCSQIQQQISIDTSLLTAQMTNTVNTLLKSHLELKSWHSDEKNLLMLAWTSSISFQQMHEDILRKRHGTTGTWLLDLDEFLNWRNNNNLSSAPDDTSERTVPATLLASGLPGAGKSVIAAIVIDHLQKTFEQDKQVAVAYAYCSRSLESRTCLDLIASLTRQIAQQHAELPQILQEEYRKHSFGAGRMSLSSYMLILSEMIMTFRHTYIVFDALDEYETAKHGWESRSITDIVESVQKILSLCGSKCRLFLTSRNNTLHQFQSIEHSSIDIKAKPEDIRSYVEGRIADPTRFRYAKSVKDDPSLKSQLVDTLVERAQGQFLLTRLHLDSLHAQISLRGLKEKILDLSVDLQEIYYDTLLRIRAQSKEEQELAFTILGWISHATGIVPLKALQHALAVEQGDKYFNVDGIIPKEQFIISCAGLVEIPSTEVKLVHPTVKDYLDATREGVEWYHKADEAMALRSLSYLALKDFTTPCATIEMEKRLEQYPFLKYAAHNFGIHASRCHDAKSVVHQKCRDFLEPDGMSLGCFQAIATKVLTFISPLRIIGLEYPPLHMAVLCGLEKIVKDKIKNHTSVDTIGPKMETPLHIAVRSSSLEMARLLLEEGADVNALNSGNKSALDMVMCRPYQTGKIHIKEMTLVDKIEMFKPHIAHAFATKWKAEIDAWKPPITIELSQNSSYIIPLATDLAVKALAQEYLDDAVRPLIDRILGANLALDISDDDEEIVKLLVHHGVDVNSQNFAELTALQFAALYERDSLLQYLLEHGANPFLKREAGYTALDIAEMRGNDKAVELLRRSMTELEKQEEEISNEARRLIIPVPKQAEEYDARSKSVIEQEWRIIAANIKLNIEIYHKSAPKLPQHIVDMNGTVCLQPKSLGMDTEHQHGLNSDRGLDDPNATVNMETTTDPHLWTGSSAETLVVPGPLTGLSPNSLFNDKAELPNAVEDTPEKASGDAQAIAILGPS